MDGIALVARLLLALVFAVAAVAKVLDQPGARRALGEFGLPERAIKPVAVLLPLAEFATAVALLAAPSARWGAIAALCLLVLFIAAIARAMARGEAPDCHCFGQVASGPAGRRTLIRNVLLAVPAVFVVAYGSGEGIDQWVSGRSAAELGAVAAGLCAALLAGLVARLWLQNRDLASENRRLQVTKEAQSHFPPGLPVGTPAPNISWPAADGEAGSLDALMRPGRPTALVFVSPGCPSCDELLPDVARWQTTLAERITIVVLSRGSVREVQPLQERYGLDNVLGEGDGEMFRSYRVRATPSVMIVAPDGRIASRTHATRVMTESLIRNALQSTSPPVVDPPPALNVVTVNGDR